MIVALLTAGALITLTALFMRNAGRERQRRSKLFADTLGLFQTYRVTQDGPNFPVLEGTYKGLPVRLEPVLDDIGVRKIPSLWLKATLLVKHPRRGVLDFIVRPQGIEIYSPSHDLPRRLTIPANWPQHAILCTDNGGEIPDLDRIEPHMTAFDDPRMKELLVTPRGIRLVYQAAQAQRGEYLVLRQARFASARLNPTIIRNLLDCTLAIAVALDAAVDVDEAKVA